MSNSLSIDAIKVLVLADLRPVCRSDDRSVRSIKQTNPSLISTIIIASQEELKPFLSHCPSNQAKNSE